MSKEFNLESLIEEVFAPRANDVFLIMTDFPGKGHVSNPAWEERLVLANEWRDKVCEMGEGRGFQVLPMASFEAVSDSNADLPEFATVNGEQVNFMELLDQATVVIAMSEVSVTGPLMQISREKGSAEKFRVASMPLANRSMEKTCLLVDHQRLVERGNILLDVLKDAEKAEVRFTTGDVCEIDLRFREGGADNGYLHADKVGEPFINLPSGEVWIVPYEGELDDVSNTKGVIPVPGKNGEVAKFVIEANRIVDVLGDDAHADALREELAVDPARRNVGEMAFGYNDAAEVVGIFIEDEKAGFHWGYGRSEFLGGTNGPEAFMHPDNVLHRDLPYAKDCPITVSVDVIKQGSERVKVLDKGEYLLW